MHPFVCQVDKAAVIIERRYVFDIRTDSSSRPMWVHIRPASSQIDLAMPDLAPAQPYKLQTRTRTRTRSRSRTVSPLVLLSTYEQLRGVKRSLYCHPSPCTPTAVGVRDWYLTIGNATATRHPGWKDTSVISQDIGCM